MHDPHASLRRSPTTSAPELAAPRTVSAVVMHNVATTSEAPAGQQGACGGSHEAQMAARNQSTEAMIATIQPQEGHTVKPVPVALEDHLRNSMTAATM